MIRIVSPSRWPGSCHRCVTRCKRRIRQRERATALRMRLPGRRTFDADRVEWHVGSRFGIGRFRPALINRDPQPVWNREHTICMVFYGELHSQGADAQGTELQTRPRSDSHRLDCAATALHLYETRGEGFVQMLNGSFALALWDSREQKLIVANDRYGLRPLYHARAGTAHLWASSPKAILSHPAYQSALSRSVNLAAMADFLCLNIPQGNETIYAGIDEMPPATLTVCQDEQARHRQYWELCFRDTESSRSTGEYVAELVHLLRQAAQRRQRTNGNTADLKAGLLLSGGHDSRVILSVLAKDDLTAFTFGVPYCDDVRFARRAAEASGICHVTLGIKADYLARFAETGIQRTEDLISCALFHGISVYDQAATRVNALITGSAGEDIFGHFCRDPQSPFWGESFSVDRYYDSKKIMSDLDLKHLATPACYQSLRGLARARFHQDMAGCPSEVQTNRIDYWSIRQQQRRLYNRLQSLFPENLEFRPLYYDNDLIDFVQTIPPSKRWGEGSIYRQVLLHTAPDLARLPFTTTCGLGLGASPQQIERRRARRKHWRKWYRTAYRLSRGHMPVVRTNGLYADYDTWFRHELKGWVKSVLMDPRTLRSRILEGLSDQADGQRAPTGQANDPTDRSADQL